MSPSHRKLRNQSLGMLLGLGLQFLLGIITNLFVKIPDNHPGANSHEYFSGVLQVVGWSLTSGFPSLALHVALGIFLVVGSLSILLRSIQAKHKKWIIVSVFVCLGILGAAFNGASFVIYGEDFSSLIMAIGFVMASAAYIFGILI